GNHAPAVATEPSHEHGNEQYGGDVDPDPRHQRHIDRGWHQHGHHLAQLTPFGKEANVGSLRNGRAEIDDARSQDQQANIERNEAGLRTFGTPAEAGLHAAGDDDQRENRHEHRNTDLDRPLTWSGATDAFGSNADLDRLLRRSGVTCAFGGTVAHAGMECSRTSTMRYAF